jgi:hypothetical protein
VTSAPVSSGVQGERKLPAVRFGHELDEWREARKWANSIGLRFASFARPWLLGIQRSASTGQKRLGIEAFEIHVLEEQEHATIRQSRPRKGRLGY